MTIRKITKFIFHPKTIKIVGLICIICFFFVIPTFAQETTATSGIEGLKKTLNDALSLFSWWWVVLAVLAWKLMTNDFVYGAFLHMDVYLWKIRNIMKNFANFMLIALVLWSIIKSLTGKEALDIKKVITNTLIAGILIQASRFLVGAIIDISTIATTAISSFPMSYLKNDAALQGEVKNAITDFKAKRAVIDFNTTWTTTSWKDAQWTASSEELRQNILPTYKSVSWPFIFLWMGVFKFQNYPMVDTTSETQKITLEFLLRFVLLFFFTVWLLLLLIANVMRIWLLWIFIIASPFLILMQIFKIKTWNWGIGKLLSTSNFVAIVFKPVIFVAWIAIMLIVILSMRNGMGSSWWAQWENNLNGVILGKSGTDTSTLTIEWVTSVSASQTDLLGKDVLDPAQNVFSMIIMLLLSIFIMWRFIKLSLTIWWWPIEETMKRLTKFTEGMAGTMPIIPFKWWAASAKSLLSFSNKTRDSALKVAGMDMRGHFYRSEAEFGKYVNENFLGIGQSRSQKDANDLEEIRSSSPNTFMTESIKIASERNEWLSLNNPYRRPVLEKWLATKEWNSALKNAGASIGFPTTGRTTDFETTFNTCDNAKSNRKALHVLMWGSKALYGWKQYGANDIPYEELKNNVYHKSS